MTDCKHKTIVTYTFEDGSPAMHACRDCQRKFVPLDLDMERDAMRYRWLLARMQEAYDSGHQVELSDNLFIDVTMPFRRKDHRRISAAISFSDVSDEPLGLSVAIDEAMK